MKLTELSHGIPHVNAGYNMFTTTKEIKQKVRFSFPRSLYWRVRRWFKKEMSTEELKEMLKVD